MDKKATIKIKYFYVITIYIYIGYIGDIFKLRFKKNGRVSKNYKNTVYSLI